MGLTPFNSTLNANSIKPHSAKFISGDQDDDYARFVRIRYERESGSVIDRQKFVFIEVRDRIGIPRAWAIFTDFTGHTISIHLHAPKYLSRAFIREFLKYPFVTAGVKRLFAPIRSTNELTLDTAQRLGFKPWAVIPEYYGVGEDQIILCARQEDVIRWL